MILMQAPLIRQAIAADNASCVIASNGAAAGACEPHLNI
tara:strand:+ start:3697 stop:3813 length:117 start_codon:yes stop_codon:yes gene_type:complete